MSPRLLFLLLPLLLRGQAVTINVPKVQNLSITLTPISKAEFERNRSEEFRAEDHTYDPPLQSHPSEGRMCVSARGKFQVSCIDEIRDDRISKVKIRYEFEVPSKNIYFSLEDSEEGDAFSTWKLEGYLPTKYMSIPVFKLDGAWCYSERFGADYLYFNHNKYISVYTVRYFPPLYFIKERVLVVIDIGELWVIDLNETPISYAVLEDPWSQLLGEGGLQWGGYGMKVYFREGEKRACVLAFHTDESAKYFLLRW